MSSDIVAYSALGLIFCCCWITSVDICWYDDDFIRSNSSHQEAERAQTIKDADTNSIDEFFETGPQVQSNEIFA